MPTARGVAVTDWQAVVARATAYLCLHQADMASASVLDQAEFLMRFGLSRPDAAQLLGSTEGSLRVLAGRRGESKSTAKKSTAKKSTAKKSTAKKSTAKKSTAKKSTSKRATSGGRR